MYICIYLKNLYISGHNEEWHHSIHLSCVMVASLWSFFQTAEDKTISVQVVHHHLDHSQWLFLDCTEAVKRKNICNSMCLFLIPFCWAGSWLYIFSKNLLVYYCKCCNLSCSTLLIRHSPGRIPYVHICEKWELLNQRSPTNPSVLKPNHAFRTHV